MTRRSRRSPSRSRPTPSSASSPTSGSTPANSRPARGAQRLDRSHRADRALLMMHANDRKELAEVYAGDIAAAVGIKQVVTGDTLAAPDRPIHLESDRISRAVIKVAVEPKTKVDQEKMSVALGRLAEEDPTFQVRTNEETGQTEISGMGELHLEVLVDRMKREFGVEANVGRPQVSYRETIRATVERHRGQVRPPDRRLGPVRRRLHQPRADSRRGLRVRRQDQGRLGAHGIHSRRREGHRRALENGVKAGYPMVDVRRRSSTASTTTGLLGDRVQGRRLAGPQEAASGPSPSCSSRSSRSRSSRPRTSSATSSATSAAGAAGSRARSAAATRSPSRPRCR